MLETRSLTIGPPGKSQDAHFLTFIVSFGTVIAPVGVSFSLLVCYNRASHVALVVKNLPANAGDIRDVGSIPGSGRSPGEVKSIRLITNEYNIQTRTHSSKAALPFPTLHCLF